MLTKLFTELEVADCKTPKSHLSFLPRPTITTLLLLTVNNVNTSPLLPLKSPLFKSCETLPDTMESISWVISSSFLSE